MPPQSLPEVPLSLSVGFLPFPALLPPSLFTAVSISIGPTDRASELATSLRPSSKRSERASEREWRKLRVSAANAVQRSQSFFLRLRTL